MRKLFILLSLPALLIGFCTTAWCQNITASLRGTVTDPSGAVVPGATVVFHNNATRTEVRTLITNNSGSYDATTLPYGTYTVIIKKTGFKNFIARDVILHVGDHRTLNAQLQTGTVTQNVTVTATSTPVQLTSPAQSTTITGTQVRELELDNRNFEQLVTLEPGVASSLPDIVGFGIENTDSVSVNGARGSANNWMVDGADVNDSGSNLTLLNVPSVDAIQEFTLERGNYDAQYGRSGGGQINVVTKSGTSQFHGDAYEFDRNTAFDANEFFANSTGTPKPPLTYNDFGFTAGGPFYIPGHYNTDKSKTFFFVSEEWRRTNIPSTDVVLLPPAAELNGTFTGTQLNPASAPAGCITNNVAANSAQISPSCFSHNAGVYLKNVYSKFTPNAPGNQFIYPVNALNNYRQDLVRIDQKITNRVQVFGRYMQDFVPTTEPGGLFAGAGLPGISDTATNAPGKNLVAHITMDLTPSVVNEAAFNYTWGAINSSITGIINNPNFLGALDTSGFPYTDPYHRVPGVTISGLQGIGIPVSPYFERNIDKSVYDNLSLVRGNHSIRTGFDIEDMTKTENAVNPTNGSFTFNGYDSGSPFADFLLGDAEEFSQDSRDIIPRLRYFNFEAYAQDDWKLKPNFTLDVGVRYSYFPSPWDANQVLNNFDPALFNSSTLPQINPVSGNFVAGGAFTPSNYMNGIIFAQNACPAALKIAPVACSPYGNYVNPNYDNSFAPRFGFAWDPFKTGKTSIRGGYGIFFDRSLNGIWEQNAFTDPPLVQTTTILNTSFDNPTAGVVSVPLGPNGLHATGTPAFKPEYIQDWNFSIEREFMNNTMLQVAYVGSKGTNLLGEWDNNQATLAARFADPTAQVNAVRPYPGYLDFTDIAPMFNSNYNSLQVSLNRRVAQGLTMGIAYTWSQNLTDTSSDRSNMPYDSYNIAENYGPADFNIPNIFIANYVYDLPFFKGQHGFVGKTLGGWEVSGITTFEQGYPTSIYQFYDPFNASHYPAGTPNVFPGGIGIDTSAIVPRPDRMAGVPVKGPGTVAEWINTGAFKDAIGHFGTSGRGVLVGPGYNNWDIALMKNFKISERFSAQVRGEFFNAFNHVSFNTLDQYTDDTTFGRLTGDHIPREIQLGAKLYF
jgi:hypothetical protein